MDGGGNMSRLLTRASLGFALTLFAIAAAAEEGSFDRTLTVEGPVEVEVATGSGSIAVQPGSSGVVKVHGEIRTHRAWFGGHAADQVRRIVENPPIEQEGNVIRIGVDRDDDLYRNVSISYEIEVPEETSLGTHTGSGSVTVGSLRGPVDARSGSGSVRVGAIGRDVKVRTGSGSIDVDGAHGGLEARSGSGSISADGIEGPITARTGSGSIELEQRGAGDVEVESGSGGIRLHGINGGLDVDAHSGHVFVEGIVAGDWDISSSSGGVTLELPDDAAFELDARTSSGHIELEHPVTVQGRLSKKTIRGTVRGGGPRVEIDSSSGSIEIR
jgi:DUF4097 and DUF4098 domain-containing protein YvlB